MLFGLFSRNNIKQLPDVDLISLVVSGNRKAEGELFIRYSPLVFGLCLKYLKNKEEAEDMLMDIFSKLPDKINKSEIQNFKNWLYSVSRNECLMNLRKKKVESVDIEKTLEKNSDLAEYELEEILKKEGKIQLLEKSILKLKDDQKTCIELFYLKNMDYKTISAETKYDLKKVKSLIQNGKRNLKIYMEGPK